MNLKDSRERGFYLHSPLCTIDGYIMVTRFWWQVLEILDFREVLKFKNIKKELQQLPFKVITNIKKPSQVSSLKNLYN